MISQDVISVPANTPTLIWSAVGRTKLAIRSTGNTTYVGNSSVSNTNGLLLPVSNEGYLYVELSDGDTIYAYRTAAVDVEVLAQT